MVENDGDRVMGNDGDRVMENDDRVPVNDDRVTENNNRVSDNDDRVMEESMAENDDDRVLENDDSVMEESVAENDGRIMEDRVIDKDDRVTENDDEAVACRTDISQPVATMQTSAVAVPRPMVCYVPFLYKSSSLRIIEARMMQQSFTQVLIHLRYFSIFWHS